MEETVHWERYDNQVVKLAEPIDEEAGLDQEDEQMKSQMRVSEVTLEMNSGWVEDS